jgi:hypothetical protein
MKRDDGSCNRSGRWIILAAAVALAGMQGQERKSMVAIATFPVESAAISGESLPFRTVLENNSTNPLKVPSVQSPSPFTYELRPVREGGRSYVVSAAARDRRRSRSLVQPEPMEYDTLAPKQRQERVEDLADMLNEGIEPAQYYVTAQYPEEHIVSPKAVVTILPAHVESFSSVVNGPSLTSAMAHRNDDGRWALLQRESLIDPNEGVFYRRSWLPAGGPVSVATGISLVAAGSGTWFGWLRDRALTASVGWGNRTVFTSEPVRVDAVQPELLNPAFQIAGGEAVFGIVDCKGNKAQLTTYLTSGDGLKLHWTAVLTSGGAGAVAWNGQPDGSVTAVWEEPSSGRLLSREFTADGHSKDAAPRVRTSSRPAAWWVAPSGPLAISVLGTFAGSYRYARLGAESTADPNPIAELPGVTGWGFNPGPQAVTIVAATAAGISLTRPGSTWQTAVKTGNPQHLHVFTASNGSAWVEWVQPGYGIRRTKLP